MRNANLRKYYDSNENRNFMGGKLKRRGEKEEGVSTVTENEMFSFLCD